MKLNKYAHYYLSYGVSYPIDGETDTDVDEAIVEAKSLADAKRKKRSDILIEYGAKANVKWNDAYRTTDDAML